MIKDDSRIPPVKKFWKIQDVTNIFLSEIGTESYFLFYEVRIGKFHSQDTQFAQVLQQKEFDKLQKNCSLQ